MSAFWRTASTSSALPGDEAAVDAERLAEGADEDVDPRAAMLLGAAAGGAVGGDAMRVVHHGDDAVAEAILVLRDEPRNRIDRRVVAAHAEDAVEDDDDAAGAVRHLPQMALEIVEVVVLEDRALRRGHVGDPHRADDAVVIQRVADPVGVGAGKRDGQAERRWCRRS